MPDSSGARLLRRKTDFTSISEIRVDDFVVLKSRRMDTDADERKKARAQWTGRLLSLSEVDEQDMTSLTVHERLCELYALSQRAFALSGKPWPQYTRATMPGRLCKLTDND